MSGPEREFALFCARVSDRDGRLAKWRELGLDGGGERGSELQRIGAFLRRDDIRELLENELGRADIEARATLMEEREERVQLYKLRLDLWKDVLVASREALDRARQQVREDENGAAVQSFAKLVDVLRKLVPMDLEEGDIIMNQREREAIARSIGVEIPDELLPRA